MRSARFIETAKLELFDEVAYYEAKEPGSVTARKDDAAAADQAATVKLAVSVSSGWDGGLIQTTSG